MGRIFNARNLSSDDFKKLGGSILKFAKKLKEKLKNMFLTILPYIIGGLLAFLLFILVTICLSSKRSAELLGTCIEADEFGQRKSVVLAKLSSASGYSINTKYKHEKFAQKALPTDLGLSLTGEPLTINITGEWIPWFGDLEENLRDITNPPKNFLCALEKYEILKTDNKFSNRKDENELYYIRNYYSGIAEEKKDGKVVIEGIEEPPERQKECWLSRGAGLYLGSFGLSGKTEPAAYHHLIASKMICSKINWFDGKATNSNYVITEYGSPSKTIYSLKDFTKNYFSLSYYLNPKSTDNELIEMDRLILTDNGNQIIYDIEKHENLLRENGIENYGLIVAHSMTKFGQACYKKSKDSEGLETRTYKAYYQFGPKTIYKNLPAVQNVKYTYGEKIKMLIVDKYYDDNQGFYSIDVISGIELDNAGSIEKKIREVEFFLLGTPKPGSSDDRVDGIVYKIFHNVLSNKFILFVRAMLALSVVIYGFRVAFGFKIDKNDKSVINKKDLMVRLFKLTVIVAITSEGAFSFFSSTILNFVINGTIGVIDLIAGIFSNTFMTNNTTSLTGGLQYVNEVISLSRNFAIVDEIISFFLDITLFSKVTSLVYVNFPLGAVVAVCILLVLVLYLTKLVQSIIPFVFVLVQFTLVLPLAPLFILFGLFEQTKFFLQNWLKFVFSKCLELVGFFMAFYFCTSIIDNFIKKLLNFKVCFKSFGDWLFKDIDLNHDFSCTGFDCMAEPFVEAYKWVLELIKNLFNLIVYPDVTGLGGHGQFFVFYCVNVAITAILVFMFDMMTKEMMGIIGNILTIDGASATMGGGKSAMQESTSGKFGLSQQLKDFAGTTGLGELQKSADGLSWTRGIYDLNKGLGENIANGALKGARVGKHLASAAGRAALAGIRGLRGNRVGAKNDIKKAGANLLEAFGELTGDAFDKNSMFDIDPKDTAAKLREDSVLSKVIAENDRSTSFKNLGRDEAETDSEKSVESLLMAKNSAALREKLKKLSSEELREIFDEETAERFSELQEDGFIEDEDEIDDLHIERIREYLKTYAKHGKDAKNKLAVSGISYNVFSDNFGKAAQPRPPVPDAIRNLSKSDRLGKMLARPIGGEEDQKYLIKRMTKFNNRTVEKLLGRKGGLTNISIAIARARYKEYGKHGIDVKLFTVQEYENMRKILGKIRYDGIAKKTEKLLRDGLGEKDLKKGLLKLDETTVRAVLDPARADRIMNAKAQLAAGEIKSKEVALGDLNDYRDDIQHFVDSKDYDNPVTGLPPPAPDPAPDGGGQAFQAGRGSDTEDEKQIDDSVLFGEDGNNKKVDSSAIIDTGNSDVIVSAGDVSVICNTGDVSSIIKAGDVGTVVSTAKESGDGDSSKKAATKEEQFKQQQEAREKMEKKLNKLKKQREELDREDQERKERENEKKKK